MRKALVFLSAAMLAFFSSSGVVVAAEAASKSDSSANWAIALASGLAIAVAAFGAALGQGRMAAAAMESIGRNPNAADRIQLPMILGLAFIEALAIYALIIAFALQGKI